MIDPIDLSNIIGTKLGNNTFIHSEQHSVHKQTTDSSEPVHQHKGAAKIQHTIFSQNQQQFYGKQEEFYQNKSKLPSLSKQQGQCEAVILWILMEIIGVFLRGK